MLWSIAAWVVLMLAVCCSENEQTTSSKSKSKLTASFCCIITKINVLYIALVANLSVSEMWPSNPLFSRRWCSTALGFGQYFAAVCLSDNPHSEQLAMVGLAILYTVW